MSTFVTANLAKRNCEDLDRIDQVERRTFGAHGGVPNEGAMMELA